MQESIKNFTELRVWKEAHSLVLLIYKITKKFPKDEVFGLISQLRRAAVSVTSNIAEGFSRQSYAEKVQFYSLALGSLTEVQSQLFIARDVGHINKLLFNEISEQTIDVHKLLNAFIKKSKSIRDS
ncbi:MAG: S23 ribosomal protein [Parcubacteria group bacterium GW2011_GWD2_43_10]|uniref:Four helix bundle protein n=2 Tax=Candidatus Vebleniibacteriota TaxID=1817921 RepID=A0A1G2Q6A9_9BACT|nr:MAG: S23 ribosomal protein [Parcubacteria group bacterium GW2011_GWD2_43_10]OHA55689.1 MAG: hypothetical protein A2429_02305 [Candidatus Veblenbacteria bacterium RIFOXYC1_FULL_42_9]OHA56883.1 MAG: hypothetical protein A2588_03595 [Candidatus Veblenbacteria bacterium RIFOXYD1_FULL_43_11]HBT92580.1 hypothetical protein [Candidatus Veblenbacteria bacterium]